MKMIMEKRISGVPYGTSDKIYFSLNNNLYMTACQQRRISLPVVGIFYSSSRTTRRKVFERLLRVGIEMVFERNRENITKIGGEFE